MAPPPFMTPGNTVLGRYQVVSLLGEGGMGSVFEVLDLALRKRRCALKVLQARLIGDATVFERFMREAEFAAGLDDEHIVRVFDRGELAPGVPFYTMELLRGRSLADVARAEPSMPWPRARHIVLQLCQVLALVHAQKIVHRDLKPENCFLVPLGSDPDFLKLLDFGLARADDGDPRLTMAKDQVGGTALYMSPEHVRGDEVDHRTDIWAVGVILHELLTGRNPFGRTNYWQVLEAIKYDEPLPPSYFDPKLPQAVDDLVARATHKQLDMRYQSAEEMHAALAAIPRDTAATADAGAVAPSSPRPPPRVHTPTALAMTQAAEQANARVEHMFSSRTQTTRPPGLEDAAKSSQRAAPAAARATTRAPDASTPVVDPVATSFTASTATRTPEANRSDGGPIAALTTSSTVISPEAITPPGVDLVAAAANSSRPTMPADTGTATETLPKNDRRRLAVVAGGATVLAAALGVVVATWETPPPVASQPSQPSQPPQPPQPPPEPAPVAPSIDKDTKEDPPPVDPTTAIDPTTAVDPTAPQGGRTETKPPRPTAKKPADPPGPLSQRELSKAVDAWSRAIKKSPPSDCKRVALMADFKFSVVSGAGGLTLTGAAPPGETSCANSLRTAFAGKFKGKALQPGARASVHLTFGG